MFIDKLNRIQDGVYSLEEEKTITDGKWEGFLNHDNVNNKAITIFTEPGFGGTRVTNFFTSTPLDMPWKTFLRVFSDSPKVYVMYESKGDQVEADDINLIQDQMALLKENTLVKSYVDDKLANINYQKLKNKPSIESVELVDNVTLEEIGVTSINIDEINNLL